MAYLNVHGLETFKGKLDIDKAKAASLAPIFSTATAYAAGARVVKDGVLYEFTASHAAGAWTGSDVITVQLGPELSDLKSEITWATPEMYGAKGDGTTNDTSALTSAAAANDVIVGAGTYLVSAGTTFTGKTFVNVNFVLSPNQAMTSGIVFSKCKLYDCSIKSTNQYPSPWNGATGNFSNIYLSGNSSSFYGCVFDGIEWLSLSTVDNIETVITGCRFVNCASGIIGTNATNVRISDCTFNQLEYAGELEHTIYISGGCDNWVVTGITSSGCKYYPIHSYNSDGEKSNPTNITLRDSAFYDAVWAIANNGELVIDNCYFDNSDSINQRWLYAKGKTTVRNCKVNGSSLLYIDTGDQGVEFDNCKIDATTIIASYGTTASGEILLTIKNSVLNVGKICDSNRSYSLTSENNKYVTYTRLVDNSSADVLATLSFKNDVFSGTGDIIYAYHFALRMIDCLFALPSAAIKISSRVTTSGNTAFMSDNQG